MENERAPDRRTLIAWVSVGVSLAAFWAAASAAHWFIDSPFLMLPVDAASTAQSSRVLTGTEWLLTQTALLFVLPAIAAAAYALRGRDSPLSKIAQFLQGDPRVVPALMATIAIAGAAFVGYALIAHTELLDDERSYMFQAELLRHGKFSEPGLPHAFRNQMILVDPVHTSKYPPGNALLLVVGMLVHAPYLIHPLLAGVLVIAVHSFVKDAFGEKQAHLAAGLAALSPFVWAIHGTVLAFGAAGAAVALLLAGVMRHDRTASVRSGVLAGAALGFLAIVRPFDAAILGGPLALWSILRAKKRMRTVALIALGVGFFIWLIPVQNHAVTGSYTKMVYTLDHENPMHLGFTRPFAGPYVHSLGGGVIVVSTVLLRLDGWLIGLPGALLVAVVGLLQRDTGAKLLRWLVALFVVCFLIIPAPGTWDVGPTYGYVLAPILFAAIAHGIAAIVGYSGRFRAIAEWAVLAAVAAALVTITPLRLARVTELASAVRSPWEFIASSGIGNANVVVGPIWTRAAAGWGYGYPPDIPTGDDTHATLFLPLSRTEYAEAKPLLADQPTYLLGMDGQAFVRTGERHFTLTAFDPDKNWPKMPAAIVPPLGTTTARSATTASTPSAAATTP
ncbi:hypothetical protein BH09MYX1_BH09MYX1_54670 [soil metagenome]